MTVPGALVQGTLFADDYRIIRALSAGGMGAVYVVHQLSTSTERALKVMHPQLVESPALRARFEQEAQLASKIESDHVVNVIAAGVDASTGMPFLVMELLHGEDFSAYLKREGPLPLDAALEIVSQLCHALGAAHRARIVHRDLKPENMFLERPKRSGVRFNVKVLDFGIAKLLGEGAMSATEALGSPLWMAPEQTSRSKAVGLTTDVWALGLIVFATLTGKSYWRAAADPDSELSALLREVVLDPLTPASQRASELGCLGPLPPGFDGWFSRCVVRETDRRFADATQAFEALVPILRGKGVDPARGAEPLPLHPTQPMQPRARTARLIGLAAGLVGLTAVSAFAISRSKNPKASSTQPGGGSLAASTAPTPSAPSALAPPVPSDITRDPSLVGRRVLYVGDQPTVFFRAGLRSEGFDIDTRNGSELPVSEDDLSRFGFVVLSDLSMPSVSADQQAALVAYARHGGALLFSGGNAVRMQKWAGSALEAALPVVLQPGTAVKGTHEMRLEPGVDFLSGFELGTPTFDDYAKVEARPDATAIMRSENGDVLLARRRVERGWALVWALTIEGGDWALKTSYSKFWGAVVRAHCSGKPPPTVAAH